MRAVFALVLIVGMGLAGVAVYMIQGYMADLEGALQKERAFNAKAGKLVEVFVFAKAKKYGSEKDEIKAQAEAAEAEYDRLGVHDDQFDISEAALSIAIALLGVSALTRKKWLVYLALFFALSGLFFGMAGFLGWTFHPEGVAKVLT
jgi:hypothetical protein